MCPTDSTTLEDVKNEIISNLEITFKETDLFKLYQTTDLANIGMHVCGYSIMIWASYFA